MVTIKLSHSILSAWSQGRQEEAVGMYLGKPLPSTPAMDLGKLNHEIWEKHIKATGTLPQELGGGELRDPITEQKYRKLIPFSDDYQILISGVPDLTHDKAKLEEFKCGRTEALNYIDSFQLDYYKLLLPDVIIGTYRAWNPYLRKLTVGIKYLSDSNAERALEHILTFGGEMIEYLGANKLIIDYKGEI